MPARYQLGCSVPGCPHPFKSRGWCQTHYRRWQRTGDAAPAIAPRALNDLVTAFWRKVDRREPGECWPWTAALRTTGYGQIRHAGRNHAAHRVAYELLIGPIPPGLQIDHLCRNVLCCNPAHLEAVTQQENLRRQNAARIESRTTR